jgi:hypothetical protein
MLGRNAGNASRRRWGAVSARAAVLAATTLLAPLVVGAASLAQAGASPPTGISVAVTTDNTGLGGAVPDVLVQAGAPFTLTVNLTPAGTSFNKDTVLDLTPTGSSLHGTFSPATITMRAGVSQASFPVSYSAADNGVRLKASVASPKTKVAPGQSASFDVVATLVRLARGDPQFPTGVGVGDAGCSSSTSEPECGIVVLPQDINSPAGALTLGRCTADLNCTPGSQVVQFVADLGTRYDTFHPATLIFRCSKQLCRNTNNGIQAFTLKVSQSASGPLNRVSQPCIAKGVADNGLHNGDTFCTDYVQSRRDSGALLLYLLFTQDMRGST